MLWRRSLQALAAALAVWPCASWAGDLSITPVRLALTPRRPITTLTVRNAGADPTTLQMRVFAWSQDKGEDILEPTQDVLANPGGFELASGASQLARFGLRAGVGPVEKSYRVLLQETTRPERAAAGRIATLLRISVPIFVEAPAGAAPVVHWTLHSTASGGYALEAANTGAVHVQLTRLTLTAPSGAVFDQPVSLYVLPGAWRQVDIRPKAPLAAGDVLTLKAATDGAALTATLRAEGPIGASASR